MGESLCCQGAVQLQDGWMHIHGASQTSPVPRLRLSHVPCVVADNRNVPALGRIGDPDDIIASVRVEEGEVSAPC